MRVVEVVFFDENRMRLVVEVADPERYSTEAAPHVPESLFRLFPHLTRHKCRNGRGHSFRREAMATEAPHLLEHLIIELQNQACHHERLCGETEWNWRIDARGLFHVYLEYENPLLALAAVRVAERIVNCLDKHQPDEVEVEHEMAYLKEVAELGVRLSQAPLAGNPTLAAS